MNKSLTLRGQDVPNRLVLILGPDSASRALSPSVHAEGLSATDEQAHGFALCTLGASCGAKRSG